MTADKSLMGRVVASLELDPLLPDRVLEGVEFDETSKPCLVVSAGYVASQHRKLKTLELRVELQTQRDDTTDAQRQEWQEAIDLHIEANARTISLAMVDDGWQVRGWSTITPFSSPTGERSWECGFEYRVVVMESE